MTDEIEFVEKTPVSSALKPFKLLGQMISAIFFISMVLLLGFSLFAYDYFSRPNSLDESITVVIPKGSSLTHIATLLDEHEVIEYPSLFSAIARITESSTSLKAGEYGFEAGATPAYVMKKIHEGDVVLHQLTIPEGLMTFQVLELLKAAPYLEGNLPESAQEGIFLPETYSYQRGESRQTILKHMQQAMETTLDALWQKRADDLPFNSKEEALVLASIVEKETALAQERGQVAAVFVNRLRKGMRLQSDPTSIYAITEGKYEFDRKLYSNDLKIVSPYNTYHTKGLPPGPIANAGTDSIKAVLNPPASDYFYFVADGSGGHAFAATLKEHNANVRAWRTFKKNTTTD